MHNNPQFSNFFSAFFHQLWTDADWELFDAINVNVFSLIIQIQVHVFRDKKIIVKSIYLLCILILCLVSRLYCTCMWNHLGDTILIRQNDCYLHVVSNLGLFLIYYVDQRGFLKKIMAMHMLHRKLDFLNILFL